MAEFDNQFPQSSGSNASAIAQLLISRNDIKLFVKTKIIAIIIYFNIDVTACINNYD